MEQSPSYRYCTIDYPLQSDSTVHTLLTTLAAPQFSIKVPAFLERDVTGHLQGSGTIHDLARFVR